MAKRLYVLEIIRFLPKTDNGLMRKGWCMMIMYCDWCGKAVETDMMPETSKHRALKRGYCYCSRECSVKGGHKRDVWTEERRKKASETMTKTNVKYHDQFVERAQSSSLRSLAISLSAFPLWLIAFFSSGDISALVFLYSGR